MKIEGAVPRVHSLSPATFREEFAAPHRPVVIRGSTTLWSASSKWTREYLEETIGSAEVRVKDSGSNMYPNLWSEMPTRSHAMKFTDYAALLWSDNPMRSRKYLSGDEAQIISRHRDKNSVFAALLQDFQFPDYFEREKLNTCGFWLSADGLIASLHYDADGSHNLNVQVRGRKRVLLFSPNECIYPFLVTQLSGRGANFSQVNIENPDYQRFPLFREARCQEAFLEEGDMLFIPSFWSHAVYHLGRVNINVNFWWRPDEFVLSKTSIRFWFLRVFIIALANGKRLTRKEDVDDAIQALDSETLRLLQSMEGGIGDLSGL
jgi:Cupin-like domain